MVEFLSPTCLSSSRWVKRVVFPRAWRGYTGDQTHYMCIDYSVRNSISVFGDTLVGSRVRSLLTKLKG